MEVVKSELSRIDIEVQTSLQYLDDESKENFQQELRTLRDDKEILEGKIRGYLALSDICKEYKTDYQRLQAEYKKLLAKVNSQQSLTANQLPCTSGSPASFYSHAQESDPGLTNRRETDQRTTSLHDPNNKSSSSSIRKPATSNENTEEQPIRTADLFDPGPDPQRSAEGMKQFVQTTDNAAMVTNQSRDTSGSSFEKFPMQESLVQGLDHTSLMQETSHMSSGLMTSHRFEMLPADNLPKRQSIVPDDDDKDKHALDDEIQTVLQSVRHDSGSPEGRILMTKLEDYIKQLESESKKTKKMNDFLLTKNSELEKKCRTQETELYQLRAQIQYQSLTAKTAQHSDPSEHGLAGWVEVQTKSQKEVSTPLSSSQQEKLSEDVKKQKETISQLREANQRWSQEWNKLQAHFEHRLSDMGVEKDAIAKELMEWKLNDDIKQRDYEKMLTNAKKKTAEEESAKEDALTQLSSANNRCTALQDQVSELKETIATLQRNPSTNSALANDRRTVGGPEMNLSQREMQTEIEVLRQQLVVFQEDFDRERQDRATAQSIKDDFKKQNESLKKRVRALEQKNSTTERQLKLAEDTNKRTLLLNDRLQTEVIELKNQLQREQENRMYGTQLGQGAIQPPIVQSAGLHSPTGPTYGGHQSPNGQTYGQQNMGQPYMVHNPQQHQQYLHQQHYQRVNTGEPMIFNNAQHQHQQQQQQYQVPSPPTQQPQPAMFYNPPVVKQPQLSASVWSCNQCTYKNLPQRTVCEMCGYIRSRSQNFNFSTGNNEPLRPRGDELNPMYPHRTPSQNDLVADTAVPAL